MVFAQTFLSKQNGYQSKSYPTKYKLINKPLYNFQKCKRLIWYLQIKPPTEEAKLGGEAHRIGSIKIENSRSGNGIGRPRESERRWNNSGNDSFHVLQSWKRKSETQNLKKEANPERVDEFTVDFKEDFRRRLGRQIGTYNEPFDISRESTGLQITIMPFSCFAFLFFFLYFLIIINIFIFFNNNKYFYIFPSLDTKQHLKTLLSISFYSSILEVHRLVDLCRVKGEGKTWISCSHQMGCEPRCTRLFRPRRSLWCSLGFSFQCLVPTLFLLLSHLKIEVKYVLKF